jgi:hypothetical protein
VLAQQPQPPFEILKGEFDALRSLRFALGVPDGQTAVGIGVDEEDRAISGAFGLD